MIMKSILRSIALCLPLVAATAVHAGVVINNTRIIFPGNDNEVTVQLKNVGKKPALVKMWLDTGDANANPDAIKVPFIIAPPIARIEAGQNQVVRVVYTGDPLPKDRESVFWFNMLDVPTKQSTQHTSLQFAFDTRIKLFFRPAGLPGSIDQAMKNLHWSVVPHGQGYALKVSNPSPYYVNLGRKAELVEGSTSYEAKNVEMVAPNGTETFDLPTLKAPPVNGAIVQYYAINDFGGPLKLQGAVTP